MKSSCSVAAPKRSNEMPRCCLFFGREIVGLPLDVGRTIYDTDLLVSAQARCDVDELLRLYVCGDESEVGQGLIVATEGAKCQATPSFCATALSLGFGIQQDNNNTMMPVNLASSARPISWYRLSTPLASVTHFPQGSSCCLCPIDNIEACTLRGHIV